MKKIIISLLSLVIITGLSFAQGQDKAKEAKSKMEEMKKKSEEKAEAGKAKAEQVKQTGKEKSAEGKAKAEQAKAQGGKAMKDAEAEATNNGLATDESGEPSHADHQHGKEHKEKGEKEQKSEKEHKGNAYGKDKAGLTGKEFGQWRSEEAKAKVKTSVEKSETALTVSEEKLKTGRDKVAQAKAKLADDVKKKKIKGKAIGDKEAKIKMAEDQLNDLESDIERAKGKVKAKRDAVETVPVQE